MRDRVVIAMSGGVDSSVAAALLVEQGYEVIGIMMRLWAEGENRCCAVDAVDDARRIAALLSIPFYLVNYRDRFRAHVVEPFIREYGSGRTPNPCLACNRHIRFGLLLQQALALDARFLATGHYAQVDQADGGFRLRRGIDPSKDQSYVLYMLGQYELQHILFPVGSYTKEQVRDLAAERGFPIADKQESMDICFVSDNDYRRFLAQHDPGSIKPGPILDMAGNLIGQHQGLPYYTIGQRRGLGIAAQEALYIARLDVTRNALIVGPASTLGRHQLNAERVTYISGAPPDRPLQVQAKIRYRSALANAIWSPLKDGHAHVTFDTPLRDITPGQAVVAYQGDTVLGGGIIEADT